MRQLAPVAAVAYLLAGWLAGALHSHAPGTAESSEAYCTTCACGHSHGKPQETSEQDEHDDGSESEHGHDCVVCHFFAQPPLAVAAVSLVAAFEAVSPAAEPVEPAFVAVTLSAWWSRGPPLA